MDNEKVIKALFKLIDDPDEEIIHVSQILTSDSVDILFESLSELKNTDSKSQAVTFVKVKLILFFFI